MTQRLELKVAILRADPPMNTQREVARALGITEVRLSRIVHGVADPTPDERRHLARILKTTQAALFPKVSEPVEAR